MCGQEMRVPAVHGSSRNCRLSLIHHKASCALKLTRSYASTYAIPREIVEIAYGRSFEILGERFSTLIVRRKL